jgi:hypothetical protein
MIYARIIGYLFPLNWLISEFLPSISQLWRLFSAKMANLDFLQPSPAAPAFSLEDLAPDR